MTPMPLEISPTKELQFILSHDGTRSLHCTLTLRHPGIQTSDHVAFKIKISHKSRYSVRPFQGVLAPNTSQQVAIGIDEEYKKSLMTYIQLYQKCMEESSNVDPPPGGSRLGGLEDFNDVLMVQSCSIEMHPTMEVELAGNPLTSFSSSKISSQQNSAIITTDTVATIDLEERLFYLWKTVESNVHIDKLHVRLLLPDKEGAEEAKHQDTGGHDDGTNSSTKVRRSTSLAVPNTPPRKEKTFPLKRLFSLNVSHTRDQKHLPQPKSQTDDELTTLYRKYKLLLRLAVDVTPKDGEEFLCGCCQTTYFSSNPTSPDRAPISSRACGHTICRSCVENCHLSQMERFTDGWDEWTVWITCPLCKAHHAFSVSDPLVNHSLCTAIAASQARHERVSRHVR